MKNEIFIRKAIKYAEKVLSERISNYKILSDISRIKPCAIIGGAVRDVLVAILTKGEISESPWRDLDIAIVESEYSNIFEKVKLFDVDIKQNTFGGLNICLGNADNLDMWTIKSDPSELYDNDYWEKYLENVDFGINAIAFILPEKRIVIREEWIDDFYKGLVEDHFFKAVKPELQSIRAIAIASRLKKISNIDFKLGQNCLKSLDWLAGQANNEEIISVFKYIRTKVLIKKWDYHFIELFERMVSSNNHSRFFKNVYSTFVDSQYNNKYDQINNI
jgi:hypothetical protein